MTELSLILVCFAVKEEASFFHGLSSASPNLRVLLTGIGKRNSERAIRDTLEQEQPTLVISSGFAGGLRADLRTGDIVYTADPETGLESALTAAGAQLARFYCAERVAATATEKLTLRNETKADAVEMESEIIRAVCREKHIPSATVRVILDAAAEDLPLDFNQLMTEDQRLSPAKLATTLLKSPAKIPALIGLQKQSKAAASKLAEVLAKVLLGRHGVPPLGG
jgi:adenosylhomocysteine nucleosidase